MKDIVSLDGKWRMSWLGEEDYRKCDREITSLGALAGAGIFGAEVPGNFELDLQKNGVEPEPFYGDNYVKLMKYETAHVFYETDFDFPGGEGDWFLCFDGIDTFADIYLNGQKIGVADNMLIPHEYPLTGLPEGKNTLLVHLKPACLEARRFPSVPGGNALPYNYESLHIRKAAHMFGWDIMPRIVSCGIWRGVRLEHRPKARIEEFYLYTVSADPETEVASLGAFFRVRAGADLRGYSLRVRGECGGSVFEKTVRLWYTAGKLSIDVKNAKLWWPRGRGEQALYGVTAELLKDGAPVHTISFTTGIRTVALRRTSLTDEAGNGEFCFYVNGERVFIKGTNWVPVDAFHSRDVQRTPAILDMAEEIGCNALRCWGGNVYESDEFFDLCDKKGFLVWQDFAMACGIYPQDAEFQSAMRAEAEAVVRRLRRHPSLMLWSGDNECDDACMWSGTGRNPNDNVITRKVLPKVLRDQDPFRPYLPSSPYHDEKTVGADPRYLPENHLWGPRDYYKSAFYKESLAHFASEIGYHGCPSIESIKKFIPPEKLWPWKDNDMWIYHAASPEVSEDAAYRYRIELMAKQVRELFGVIPDSLADFSLASQLSQAEAFKFFIELFRAAKWRRTGLIWWNLIDGWPQFSDAVVDYYFNKKAAFDFIKRAQRPVCLMFAEPENWRIRLIASNDTRQTQKVVYRVTDAFDGGKTVLEGAASAKADTSAAVAEMPYSAGEKHLYLIEWECGKEKAFNHYLAGNPPFDFKKIAEAYRRLGLLSK